ncbi:hypothetical protein NDU88_010170 [Pleurodeles waltl]|uniref:Uncharacterized protein n=1 Tax=Pleurodeles waltl TaxID=8319 RepID=A0AAV7PZA0_PLEWA|nr:hypothetical protein NDU88_010170 [Pleurodeles waltl]
MRERNIVWRVTVLLVVAYTQSLEDCSKNVAATVASIGVEAVKRHDKDELRISIRIVSAVLGMLPLYLICPEQGQNLCSRISGRKIPFLEKLREP